MVGVYLPALPPSASAQAPMAANASVALDAELVAPIAPVAPTGAEPDIPSYAVTLVLDIARRAVSSFMVAAYKEQRWGAAAYERELHLFRERHQRAVEANFDVKLAFAGEYPSLQVRRAITYSKAALFLHRLRQELGETSFWAGLARFTRERAGQSVESRDFEQAFAAASGRDLSTLFGTWVYD